MLENDAASAVVSIGSVAVANVSSFPLLRESEIENAATAVVYAGDYLNKLSGESIERECRSLIALGTKRLVVNFSRTEIVNSIGVSILLGVIDAAVGCGASVVFSDVNDDTVELFEMLGLTNHVQLI